MIESEGTPLRVPYQYYRAQKEFRQLTGWLRSKGVNFPRPLHTLREEFGSQICLHHGIHAASSALRHGALRVTTDHYVEAKVHATSGLGRLLGLAEAENIKQGTGWFLNQETVLTDFHVIEDGIRFAVFYEDGQSSEALFLKGNSACDLAALTVTRPRADQGFLPLIADSNAILPNTPVFAIGYPHGNRTVSTGKLFEAYTVDRVRQYGNYALFKSDLCSTHGGSGGPVLDAQGEVVGMLEAKDWEDNVYVISANVIWEGLDLTGGDVHPGGFRTGASSELHLDRN